MVSGHCLHQLRLHHVGLQVDFCLMVSGKIHTFLVS